MKKYLLVSDLHSGSVYGLMPPQVVEKSASGDDELVHEPSASQIWLLDRWNEMRDTIGKERIHLVVCNGDSCDGLNKKGNGHMLWTTNLDVQAQAAADLLKMVKPSHYALTMGSGYHSGENLCLDEIVAHALEPVAKSHFSADLALNDEQEGIRIHCSHNIAVSNSSWQRPSTPLARELLMALLNEKEYGVFDVLVRSHAHCYCMVEIGSHIAFITPGWQLRTPYEVKIGLSMLPQIGYVFMEVEHGKIWKETKIWSPKSPIREIRL